MIDLHAIAEKMNTLPFVRWDRLTDADDTPGERRIDVYGWIDRPDGRSDFIVLTFGEWTDSVGWLTSSAEYDPTIRATLDPPGSPNYECQRVEDVFGSSVGNAVRLVSR